MQLSDSVYVRPVVFFGVCTAVIAACLWAYWPGLAGPFLLDDNASIADLGNLGGVKDWHSFKAFVFGGYTGPTGRPLALLTFLIDANNWPADPWPFKRTNLIIHILCGIAVAALMNRLLSVLRYDRQTARWCALVAAACWLLHPFLVSTTLYAVQRMTQLAALFVFIGLNGYLYGRTLIEVNARKAYVIMTLSVSVCTLLAMLSKENGILLPILVGVLELTIFRDRRQTFAKISRSWAIVFIVVPSLVTVLYLGYRGASIGPFEPVPGRDFSIYERLITEFRIVAEYLRHWFVPQLYTTGVFQDHVVKSTGLLSPVSTLITLLMHVAIVVTAFLSRRRQPMLAFAVLFFYAGHLLESTVLNLELYFEHRNYLPAAFLLLPLVGWAGQRVRPQVFAAVSLAVLLMLAGFTRYSATIWSDYRSIVQASAEKAPTSVRAQQQYAMMLFNEQRHEEALRVIERASEMRPESDELLVTRSMVICHLGAMQPQDFSAIEQIASSKPYSAQLFDMYSMFVKVVIDRQCVDNAADRLRGLFDTMLQVPANADPSSLAYSHIRFFEGYIEVRRGKPAAALTAFRRSLNAREGADHAMFMAAILASEMYFEEALLLSEMALEQLDEGGRGVLHYSRVREADIREFQANVRAELGRPDVNEKD